MDLPWNDLLNRPANAALLKTLALPVVSVLISIFSAVFFIIPTVLDVGTTYRLVQEKQDVLADRVTRRAFLEDQDEREVRLNFDRVSTYLPPTKDLPLLFSSLASLEAASGLSIQSIQLTPASLSTQSAQQKEPEAMDISIAAVGSLRSLEIFLQNLEESVVLLRVQDAQYTQSNQGGIVNAQLKTYVLPQGRAQEVERSADLTLTAVEQERLSRL